MKQFLKVITWVFMGLAVVFFWISLRSIDGNLAYTFYALGMIVVAWITNYILKRYEKEEKD